MSVDVSLRKFLLEQPEVTAVVAERVHQDHVPQQILSVIAGDCSAASVKPYIWFSRSGTDREECLDVVGGLPDSETFALELVGPDLDQVRLLAESVQRLDGSSGPFGNMRVQTIFVEDQSDDYESVNPAAELGLSLSTFSVTVIPDYSQAGA